MKLPGLYFVNVSLKGSDGASCVAQGWMKIKGNPVFTPIWIAGLVFILFGLAGWVALLKRLLGIGRRAARIGATSRTPRIPPAGWPVAREADPAQLLGWFRASCQDYCSAWALR